MAASNNYKLYSRGWRKDLRKFLSGAKQLTIVSPYIRLTEAKFVVKSLPKKGANITTITKLEPSSLLGGSLEIGALKILEKISDKSMIINKRGLHAKIYVADKKRAIITSANLTKSGIDTNYEYGVGITDESVVRQICTHIDGYVKEGRNIDVDELNRLATKVRVARNKQKELQKCVPPEVKQIYKAVGAWVPFDKAALKEVEQFREVVSILGKECKHLYVNNNRPITTTMFKKPICHLLKDHPMTTTELYKGIQKFYPELCVDNPDSTGIVSGRRDKVWKHTLRNAQQTMKESGIIKDINKKWKMIN